MNLISFWYDKTDHSDSKLRFIAVKTSDSSYIHGYDMLDNCNYKQFLRSKIHGPITHWGNEQDDVLLNGSVVDIDTLLQDLHYTLGEREVVKLLADDKKIVDLYRKKTGNRILALTGGYFFKYGPAVVDINMSVNGEKITMKISEGVIEFYYKENKITHLGFTRMVLGITKND